MYTMNSVCYSMKCVCTDEDALCYTIDNCDCLIALLHLTTSGQIICTRWFSENLYFLSFITCMSLITRWQWVVHLLLERVLDGDRDSEGVEKYGNDSYRVSGL